MAGRGVKILASSFWIVTAVHLAVFTAIGFATSSWRLLWIFIAGFAAIMTVYALGKFYFARRPDKKAALNNFLHKLKQTITKK